MGKQWRQLKREATRRWGGLGHGEVRYEGVCRTLEYVVGFVHFPGGCETFVECGRGGSWAGAWENADQREKLLTPRERRERAVRGAERELQHASADWRDVAAGYRHRSMRTLRRTKMRLESAREALERAQADLRATTAEIP